MKRGSPPYFSQVLLAVALAGLLLTAPAPALAACAYPLGDINESGETDIIDVQCTVVLITWVLTGAVGPGPKCKKGELATADLNCDGVVNVTDSQLNILYAFGAPLSDAVDLDSDLCPDLCDDDADGDGVPNDQDCEPFDAGIYPGSKHACGDCNPATLCVTANGKPLGPIAGKKPVDKYYDYGGSEESSSNMGVEMSNRAVVQVYVEPDGDQFLVLTLDKPGDEDAGEAKLSVTGAAGAEIAVYDDPGDLYAFDPGTGEGAFKWIWYECCSDGLVLGPLDGPWCATLDMVSSLGLVAYTVLGHRDTLLEFSLAEPLEICSGL